MQATSTQDVLPNDDRPSLPHVPGRPSGRWRNRRARRARPVCRVFGVCVVRHGLSAVLCILLIVEPAHAGADDTLTLTAGIAVQHDDNLFRLSSSADPNALLGKSTKADDITVTSLALKLSKRYSLQHVELEASLLDNRYSNFNYLNFLARNYAASWHWRLTPHLYGNLSSDRKESPNSFGDYSGYTKRNLRTDENQRFDGVYEVGSAWRILAGVSQTTRTNSELFSQEGDTRLNTGEAGLRYDFRSGASLGAVTRSGRGEYFNRAQPLSDALLDNRFDQTETEVRLLWPVTGKASVDLRVARLDRKHAHFGERDFSGPVGKLLVGWRITDKTSLSASLGRELGSYQSVSSSYISTDRFTLTPSWQISAKTALRGRYDYARRDFRGAVSASPQSDRFDTVHSSVLTLEWKPWRDLALNATLQNDRRTSNLPGYDYDSTMAGVSAQFTF